MALWNRFKGSAQTMQSQLVAARHDLRSGTFRDAAMAMCALVVAADGVVDPAERHRFEQLIATNEVLRNFPPDELRRLLEDGLARLADDFELGRIALMQVIGKVRKPNEARAVVQFGIVMGGADGTFDRAERALVREACFALHIPPVEFDL